MRRVKPALARTLLVALFLAACRENKPAEERAPLAECVDTVVRVERQRVVTFDGALHDDEQITCHGRSRCVGGGAKTRVHRAEADVLVVEVGERTWRRPWRETPSLLYKPAAFGNSAPGALAVALLDDEGIELLSVEGERRLPLPAIAPGLRLTLPFVLDDGVGMELVTDAGRPAPGIPFVWLAPPSREDLRGASESVPVIDAEGAFHGHMARVVDGWLVKNPEARPPELLVRSKRPPRAWARGDDYVVAAGRRVTAYRAGEATYRRTLRKTEGIEILVEGAFVLSEDGSVERLSPQGSKTLLGRAAGVDLAGNSLPAGARVERVRWAHDGRRRVAAIERVRTPGCRIDDRVHVVDLVDERAETVARGEAARLHPTFVRGKLTFVEADVRYDTVADR